MALRLGDIDDGAAYLAEARKQNQKYATELGVARHLPFLDERAAVIRFSREDDCGTYRWSHQLVHGHGNDTSWMHARRRPSDDTVTDIEHLLESNAG